MSFSRLKKGCLRVALFLCLSTSAAYAHGVRNDIRVDLAPVKVDGLVVELHQDFFSPQLAVSNRTGKLLEILDADGRAFVRIGPGKAEGDFAAKAYHLSRIAGGGDAHANTLSATPRWRTITTESAYGWFDTRIATATLDIPYAVKQIGTEMPFGQWRIPARLGGEPLELRGVFTYTPPPAGIAMAVMQSPTAIAPGVIVQMVPGPIPAFFLRNTGERTVAVLDAGGKPFLKVGKKGVWADAGNASWRAASPTTIVAGTSGWQQVSKSGSITWLEPRAAWAGKLPSPLPASAQLNEWRIPLKIGEQRAELRGINRWLPRHAANEKLPGAPTR